MTNKGRFPKWVTDQVSQGYAAKRLDGKFFLLLLDDPSDRYGSGRTIGEITPEGIVDLRRPIHYGPYHSSEYGFSKACLCLCPPEWKKSIGPNWSAVLTLVVSRYAKASYLLNDFTPCEDPRLLHHSLRLDVYFKQKGTSLEEMFDELSDIRLIENHETGEQAISIPTARQIEFCRKLGIDLEEV